MQRKNHTHKELPEGKPWRIIIGIDLAISTKDSADYSSMVVLVVYGFGTDMTVYVLPFPFNERVSYPEFIRTVKETQESFIEADLPVPEFVVESNGFQEIYLDMMNSLGLLNDKRSRLAVTGDLIEGGLIYFPEKGAEELIAQLTGFGRERHDDLCDAFTTAVHEIMAELIESRPFETWKKWVKKNDGSAFI